MNLPDRNQWRLLVLFDLPTFPLPELNPALNQVPRCSPKGDAGENPRKTARERRDQSESLTRTLKLAGFESGVKKFYQGGNGHRSCLYLQRTFLTV